MGKRGKKQKQKAKIKDKRQSARFKETGRKVQYCHRSPQARSHSRATYTAFTGENAALSLIRVTSPRASAKAWRGGEPATGGRKSSARHAAETKMTPRK
jgi:hypothetical protein